MQTVIDEILNILYLLSHTILQPVYVRVVQNPKLVKLGTLSKNSRTYLSPTKLGILILKILFSDKQAQYLRIAVHPTGVKGGQEE